jgi:hypothetical protein
MRLTLSLNSEHDDYTGNSVVNISLGLDDDESYWVVMGHLQRAVETYYGYPFDKACDDVDN